MNKFNNDKKFNENIINSLMSGNSVNTINIISERQKELNKELISASGSCSLRDIQELISKGADPCSNNEALLMSATFGNLEVADLYINTYNMSPDVILNDSFISERVKLWAKEQKIIKLNSQLNHSLDNKTEEKKKRKI